MYIAKTHDIQIEAEPAYVPEHSNPQNQQFVFTYKIRITNLGQKTAQLLDRHWIIRDGNGKIEEVRGPGVVGEQPKLEPGQSYEYSSFCPLPTPTGNMRGTYTMKSDSGTSFQVTIPLFFLRDESQLH